MKSRPIIFNTEMVKAILDGRKTQERRVIKNQDDFAQKGGLLMWWTGFWGWQPVDMSNPPRKSLRCPYSEPCDELWVKETWATIPEYDDYRPVDIPHNAPIYYKADGIPEDAGKLRPSMFMPRWAFRITLVVKNVRIERIQDISEEDAFEEGISLPIEPDGRMVVRMDADDKFPITKYMSIKTLCSPSGGELLRAYFAAIWDSINAKRGFSWDSNPFVWAVEFEVKK